MIYWIDVCDSNGSKLGDGPILSALDWTYTANLDAAGRFAFVMPRDDPRAQYVQTKRIVMCWTVIEGALRHLGSGIINDVQTNISEDGRALLSVAGANLLDELNNRIIRFDTFDETVEIHPSVVRFGDTNAVYTYDGVPGDGSTYSTFGGGTLDSISVFSPYRFDRITFKLHSVQTQPETGRIYYTNGGESETDADNWTELTADYYTNDTIAPGGFWFAQDGSITFNLDGMTSWTNTHGGVVYGVRIAPPISFAGWSAFNIYDVSIRVTQPTNDAIGKVMTYAPAGWVLDAGNGYTANQTRPVDAVELVKNGGFEAADSPLAYWTNYIVGSATITQDGTTAHSGSYCARLTTVGAVGGNTDFAGIGHIVPVEPLTEYTLSFWTRGDGTHMGQWRMSDADVHDYPGYLTCTTDTMITGTTWTQVTLVFTTPATTNNLLILLYSPLDGGGAFACFDDVSVRKGGGKAITLDSQGETVLENLLRIAETTGEHFIESPNPRQVLWLGKDVRDSQLRAIAYTDPLAVEGHDDICLIQSLTEQAASVDLISRVYPYGGGAEPIPTLRNTTRPVPDGYTLDRTNNYIVRNQSEAAYGRIERRLDASDIANVSGNTSGDIHSCNMLFDRALLYLQRHSATNLALDGGDLPRTYQVQLVKCARLLLPGYTLRLEYDRYVAGVRTMRVYGDYWITSSTLRADASGVHTLAVTCSTVDEAPRNEYSFLVDLARRVKGMMAHQ